MFDMQLEGAVGVEGGAFDHKQYVETDKRQLRPKVSRHNFFHKNQHLKYQGFPKASCQQGE